jgi:hypothetical protein
LTGKETELTGSHTAVTRATTIDSRVGCLLDGAVVYFEDGHKTPCGPRWEKEAANTTSASSSHPKAILKKHIY